MFTVIQQQSKLAEEDSCPRRTSMATWELRKKSGMFEKEQLCGEFTEYLTTVH